MFKPYCSFLTELRPCNTAIMTRCGTGKFVLMFKSKSGQLEEWKLSFDRHGMTMVRTFSTAMMAFKICGTALQC